MTLFMGFAAPMPVGGATAVVAQWTLDAHGVVLLGDESLRSVAAEWITEPATVTQLGLVPEAEPGYGRVVVGRYRLDAIHTAIGISRTLLAPISQRPGFVGTLVAVDCLSGSTFSLSLWASAAAASSHVDDGWFAARVAEFRDCYVTEPQTFSGDVHPEGRAQ
jgi:hypothetical protein